MAENKNLATFEFDTTRLESSLDRLQKKMFELKKEQELYNNTAKTAKKVAEDLTKAQIALVEAGEENSDAFEKNAKEIEELNAVQMQNYKNSQNVATNMARVRQEITATNTQLKAYMDSEANQTTLIDAGNVALGKQITNINEARASNTELLRVRNQLKPLIEEEAALMDELNARLDSNNEFIKENASAYEQQKINIGNYSESIKEALGGLNLFNGGLSGFAGRAQEAGGAGALLTTSLKTATTATVGLTKSMLAFLFTPIGAVLAIIAGAFLLIKNAMDKNKESGDKITSVFKGLSSIFNSVLKVLEPLGTFIIDVLVGAFEMLGNTVEKVALAFADAQEFFGFGDAAAETRGFIAETKEATKSAYELAKAERELEQSQMRARLTQLEYQKGAEKLRQVRDDESKSMAERIQANKDLGVLLDEQAVKELAIAKQALKVAEMRASASKLDKTLQADYLEALTQIADIEERITGQRSEKLANDNSLRRDYAAQEKARQDAAIAKAKERQDAAIKAMQTELDFYIESQGQRKKSMSDQIDFDRKIMEQSLAIAKAEFEAKKTTRREYDLAILEIQNEFLKAQTDATIENANLEFEIFKLNNQRKLDENQFFSDELYNQELERINRLAEAEAAEQTRKFQAGLLNAEEYGLAIRQIDENQQNANDEATATREQAKKDKATADILIQDELNAERFDFDLQLQLERYEREYALRKAEAEKNGADMIAFEENEAKKKQLIQETVENNKLQLASQTFGNLIALAGKESAAGKALAIAQTTIDTYLGAQKAYTSQLIVGDPSSPFRAALAAGAAVASGLANVKKIVSVKSGGGEKQKNPGYARGVIGLDGLGTGTSDSISANLSSGESVITARATQMFPELLGALNQAGGGVGLSGSTSTLMQDSFSNNSNNTEAIANAVFEATLLGTMKGTADGMIGLSDNREVMNYAKA